MAISTVSFDKAKIYKNKMFFAEYSKNGTSLRVFDNFGKNIFNRITYNPTRTINDDKLVIMKKQEFEFPNQSIIFKTVKRIYDKFGNLKDIKKEINIV